MLGCTVVKHRH